MDVIEPVSAVPTSYKTTEVVYTKREGKNPKDIIVTATVYEVITYDKNGKLETTTNVHQTDYLA